MGKEKRISVKGECTDLDRCLHTFSNILLMYSHWSKFIVFLISSESLKHYDLKF